MNRLKTKAKVLYFDRLSGEGMIQAENQVFVLYACNIEGKKTWYPETACVYYVKDQEIDVELKWDNYACFAIGLTQGTVDQEKWNRLDQSRLAFKCDESGKAVNGLFGG